MEQAKAWLELDPDPKTQSQLKQLLSDDSNEELEALFGGGQLSFGTAGLRAELGPGPLRMNRVLIQLVTKALFEVVAESSGSKSPKILIGYDGRENSNIFAWDAVGVINDLGGTALLLDQPLPTPVLARSVLSQAGDAGIMVTASHNPRQDNGYKVYWPDGGQITSPADRLVEQKLSGFLKDLANADIKDFQRPDSEISEAALADYIECLFKELSSIEADPALKIVYTPLHGVGKHTLEEVFKKFNFPAPIVVAAQAEPDASFPTAAYPNPEEAGALDLALALAQAEKADLILANDPDADRLCVCLPESDGSWRTLSGNELGILLADYCMSAYLEKNGNKGLVATTCVSSQMLSRIAESRGVEYVETLTGFKWISRADSEKGKDKGKDFIFGYEEALGYSVMPQQIRDKDGISAAVAFVNLFSQLRQQEKTPLDRLNELAQEYGMHLTLTASIRYDTQEGQGQEKAAAAMARLRSQLPEQIGGKQVLNILDYSTGESQRPANMISFYLEGDSRIVVRPSGTEPKLKVYVELVEKDMARKAEAQKDLEALTDAAAKLVSSGS